MPFTENISRFVDWFYFKPLQKIISRQIFRYLACGAINYALTTLCYAISYYLIFSEKDFNLGFVVISPRVASLGISMPVSFLLGFWLQRNVSFKHSPLKGHIQFIRYFEIAMVALAITYALTKFFARLMPDYPTAAFTIIYLVTAVSGFIAQKYFSFRGAEKE